MKFSFDIKMKPTKEIVSERGLGDYGRAQKVLDREFVRLSSPNVPVDSRTLQRRGSLATDF